MITLAAADHPFPETDDSPTPDHSISGARLPLRRAPEPLHEVSGESYRDYLTTVAIRRDESISQRRDTRVVLCGDHGPSINTLDVCQWCGGFAVPFVNAWFGRKSAGGDTAA